MLDLKTMYGGMSEAQLALLGCSDHRTVVVAKGEAINSSATKAHLLVDGWACRHRLLSNGRRQIVSLHLSGEMCDLDKVVFPGLSFGVIALSECRVRQIPLDWLRRTAETSLPLKSLLWSLTALENVTMSELVTSLGKRPARERIAWFYCDLACRLEARGKISDGRFHFELTQADLADMLGLSVVHVNRTLQTLKSEELISFDSRACSILDRERLCTIAHYDVASTLGEDLVSRA